MLQALPMVRPPERVGCCKVPFRLLLAFVLPLVAGVALGWFGPGPASPNFVQAICPSVDVPAGLPLDDARFRRCAFPASYVPADAISQLEPTRTIDRAIRKGEPVRSSWLGPARGAVAQNLRSTPFTFLRREALAPFLAVGDFVDVLWVSTDPATRTPFVRHLVQFVSVADIVPADADHVMVALSVGPEEAALLAHAERNGRLVLTLRHPEDVDVIEERGISTAASLIPERMRILMMKRYPHCTLIRGANPDPPDASPPGPARAY